MVLGFHRGHKCQGETDGKTCHRHTKDESSLCHVHRASAPDPSSALSVAATPQTTSPQTSFKEDPHQPIDQQAAALAVPNSDEALSETKAPSRQPSLFQSPPAAEYEAPPQDTIPERSSIRKRDSLSTQLSHALSRLSNDADAPVIPPQNQDEMTVAMDELPFAPDCTLECTPPQQELPQEQIAPTKTPAQADFLATFLASGERLISNVFSASRKPDSQPSAGALRQAPAPEDFSPFAPPKYTDVQIVESFKVKTTDHPLGARQISYRAVGGADLRIPTVHELSEPRHKRSLYPPMAASLERHALVIGNNTYADGLLTGSVNDAWSLAHKLSNEFGFVTTLRWDLTASQMSHAIAKAVKNLPSTGATFVLYFAGRGEEHQSPLRKLQYLRGTDGKWVSLRWVLGRLANKDCMKIVLLDCCRNGESNNTPRVAELSAPFMDIVSHADDIEDTEDGVVSPRPVGPTLGEKLQNEAFEGICRLSAVTNAGCSAPVFTWPVDWALGAALDKCKSAPSLISSGFTAPAERDVPPNTLLVSSCGPLEHAYEIIDRAREWWPSAGGNNTPRSVIRQPEPHGRFTQALIQQIATRNDLPLFDLIHAARTEVMGFSDASAKQTPWIVYRKDAVCVREFRLSQVRVSAAKCA